MNPTQGGFRFDSLKSSNGQLSLSVDDDGTAGVASVTVIDNDAVTDNAAINPLDGATDSEDLSVRHSVSVPPWQMIEAERRRALIERLWSRLTQIVLMLTKMTSVGESCDECFSNLHHVILHCQGCLLEEKHKQGRLSPLKIKSDPHLSLKTLLKVIGISNHNGVDSIVSSLAFVMPANAALSQTIHCSCMQTSR
jgi:hypothetical protein